MDISWAFDQFQAAVNADPDAVKEGRRRRDLFIDAFKDEDDVLDAYPSGSLARSTQIEPINDVDVVVVFDPDFHSDWGAPGDSAEDALVELQGRVRELLGTNGSFAQGEVRLAKPQNHAVKCFLDDPGDPGAFTVDATPALPGDGTAIHLPEKDSRNWIDSNPKYLIEEVRARQQNWLQFRPLVRCLKRWSKDKKAGMKSLLTEVLAIEHLPEESRPRALSRFFTAAAAVIQDRIEDPAELSGPIQPNLDTWQAHRMLEEATDSAAKAVAAQDRGDTDEAACHWREIFGIDFPEPEGGCKKSASRAGFFVGAGGADEPRTIIDAPQG
jgi:hypothetical protein